MKAHIPPRPELLPLGVVAARLRVHPKALREACEAGELPSIRVGSAILLDPERIRAILVERAQSAGSGREARR